MSYKLWHVVLALLWFPAYAATTGQAWGACTSPNGVGGQIVFNSDHKVLQYCDGTDWIGMGWKGASLDVSGNAGALQFKGSTGQLASDNLLYWDNAQKRLGVGTDEPAARMHVEGTLTLGGGTEIWAEGGGLRFKGASDVEGNGAVFYDGDNNILVRIRTSNYSGSPLRVDGLADYTTANAANVYVTSAGNFARVTSSARYKDAIEDITPAQSQELFSLRAVTYTSKARGDDAQQRYYGFIAEEVAQTAPMLVHWKLDEESQKNIPDGVAYERVSVLLQAIVKEQDARIRALETRLQTLENAAN